MARSIDYGNLMHRAMRSLIQSVLTDGGENGLPGAHHFYITFKTGAPGVSIPPHLRERFPDEMTVVLQNKFWDLKVHDDAFEVGLTFNAIPAKEPPFFTHI